MEDPLRPGGAGARTRARIALASCVLLCLVGAGIAWDLTRVWVLSRTDPDYHSFCAVSEGMNCETVALSSWSAFLGAPNSVWALAAYGDGLLRDASPSRTLRLPPHPEPHPDGVSCGDPGTIGARAGPQPGTTDAGESWIGAPDTVLEIHEFTDYECPHCRRAHMTVRKLLSSAGDRVRAYHRHLPLDQACNPTIKKPFHQRACRMSFAAVCAGRQGRFWEMNDLLFQQFDGIREKDLSPRDLAARLELDADAFACCMDEASTREAVARALCMTYENGIVPSQVPVHPTPLYEAAVNFALFGLLWKLRGRFRNPGGV